MRALLGTNEVTHKKGVQAYKNLQKRLYGKNNQNTTGGLGNMQRELCQKNIFFW